MPTFKWKGKNKTGNSLRGNIDAISEQSAILKLKQQGLIPVSLKPTTEKRKITLPIKRKVNQKELMTSTKQLFVMLKSGVSLTKSIDVLANQQKNAKFAEILRDVKKNIEEGLSFADALRKHKNVFPPLYTSTVEAGEMGGNLDESLENIAALLERSLTLKRKIKGALAYPVIVSIVAIAVIILILVKVIPTFAGIYQSAGMHLPLPTTIIINISMFVRKAFLPIILGIIALVIIIKLLHKRNERARKFIDNVLLHLPLFGKLINKGIVARLSTTISSLVKGGLPLLEAINIAVKTAGNKVIEDALSSIRDKIRKGETVANAFSQAHIFEPMVVQMISVGEETGALDEMLENVSRFYEAEVDDTVKNLTSIMEPVMIVVLGGIIGFIVIAMYLPIFKLGEVIH
ncbi:MAG: type II secretion system F family protein [Deltaproteobacteria bacterium]|nr:type II secretion system F family protein [Deltaproteobacteria bacterium]